MLKCMKCMHAWTGNSKGTRIRSSVNSTCPSVRSVTEGQGITSGPYNENTGNEICVARYMNDIYDAINDVLNDVIVDKGISGNVFTNVMEVVNNDTDVTDNHDVNNVHVDVVESINSPEVEYVNDEEEDDVGDSNYVVDDAKIVANQISFLSLNVCGLRRRTHYPDFIEMLEHYDIIGFQETKTDILDEIEIDGFQVYLKHRTNCLRKSGGIGVAYRNNFERYLTICDN